MRKIITITTAIFMVLVAFSSVSIIGADDNNYEPAGAPNVYTNETTDVQSTLHDYLEDTFQTSESYGDGLDGSLHVTSANTPYELDTNANPDGFDFINITVDSGCVLTTTADSDNPLIIRATGIVDVKGSIDVSGYIDADYMGRAGGYNRRSGPGKSSDVTFKGAGGAGYGTQGQTTDSTGGSIYGFADLRHFDNPELCGTTYSQYVGGSGAGDGKHSYWGTRAYGGAGGGVIKLTANEIQISGSIKSNGGNGADKRDRSGGGGSGGTIWMFSPLIQNTGTIEAIGGQGGSNRGGDGGKGRIRIDCLPLISSTSSNPTAYMGSLDIPIVSNVYPPTESNNVNVTPELSVDVEDVQGDEFTVRFETNQSGTWEIIEEHNGGNGTYTTEAISLSDKNTRYYWRVYVEDSGGHSYYHTFEFTTGEVDFLHPIPGDTQTYVRFNPTLSFVLDNQVDTRIYSLDFQTNESGSWESLGKFTGSSLNNQRYYLATNDVFNSVDTTYFWKIVAKDTYGNTYENTYQFSTASDLVVSGTETIDIEPWEWPDSETTSREYSLNSLTVEDGATLTLSNSHISKFIKLYVYDDININGTLTASSGSGPIEIEAKDFFNVSSTGTVDLSANKDTGIGGGYTDRQGPGKCDDSGSSCLGGGGYANPGGGSDGGDSYGFPDLRHWDNDSYSYNGYTQCVGGSGGAESQFGYDAPDPGGAGGGAIKITAYEINIQGDITSNGGNGQGNYGDDNGAGGGSGGTIWLHSPLLNITGNIQAEGGNGYEAMYCSAGDGSDGRIRIDYGIIIGTGTISPTPYEGEGVILLNYPRDMDIVPTKSYTTLNVSVYFGEEVNASFVDASDDSTIHQFTNVSNGESIQYNWSGLTAGHTYEWYVTVNGDYSPTGEIIPMNPDEKSDEWAFTTQTDQVAPTINSFNIDTTNGYDLDNDDIQIDWNVYDVNGDIIDLYFKFGKGNQPIDPTISNYDAHLTNVANTESNYDLNWEHNISEWCDFSGTVYVKMIAYDGNYSNSTTVTIDGIDGTVPQLTYNAVEQSELDILPTLDIDFKDNISQLKKAEYKIDSDGTWYTIVDSQNSNYTTDWQPDTDDWISTSNGVHYMYFRLTDNAGNIYTTSTDEEAFNFTKNALLNYFEIHDISGWDTDNDDIEISWNTQNDSTDLYFTFKKGSLPDDPTDITYHAHVIDAGDESNYDLDWENNIANWTDYSGTVYIKVNATNNGVNKIYTYTLSNGIDDGPEITAVQARPDGYTDVGEVDDDTEIYLTYSVDSLCGIDQVYAELNDADPDEPVSGGQDTDIGVQGTNTYYVKAVDILGSSTIASDDISIIGEPSVTTNDATEINLLSAVFNGYLNEDGGENCTVDFQYGTQSGVYTFNTTDQTKATGESFSVTVSLEDGTTYYYRTRATNQNSTVYGSEKTFSTLNSVSLGTPSIPNEDTNVPITTKWWNISISDVFGSFNYSIETSPDIGSISETNSANGTKACFLTNLRYGTTYNVYVNVTGSQRNETYNFTTEGGAEIEVRNTEDNSNYIDIKKDTPINLSTFVDPRGIDIDTVSTYEVTFTGSLLDVLDANPGDIYQNVSFGDLFDSTTFQLGGIINNTDGTITEIVWGNGDTNTPGTMYYMNFNSGEGTGTAYVNLTYDEIGFAHDMVGDMPFDLVSNATIFIHYYEPSEPSPFTATTYSQSEIDLSWTKDVVYEGPSDGLADTTYIERNTVSSWSRGDGTMVYNDSGISFRDSELSQQVTYYYQAWSYNATDNLFSPLFATANDTTSELAPPSDLVVVATDNSYGYKELDLSWVKADQAHYTYVERNTAPTWSRGAGTMIYNDTGTWFTDTGLDSHTTYYYQAWSYNISLDDAVTAWSNSYSDNYNTTLNNAPEAPVNPGPADNAPYESVYNCELNATVYDLDLPSETFSVEFWFDGSLVHTATSVANDSSTSYDLTQYIDPDWLNHDSTYTWYIKVNDTVDVTTSATWSFNTSHYSDVNEDGIVNYLDVSALSSVYRTTCTPGSIGSDLNNDGEITYLDVSGLVSDYYNTYP